MVGVAERVRQCIMALQLQLVEMVSTCQIKAMVVMEVILQKVPAELAEEEVYSVVVEAEAVQPMELAVVAVVVR